MYAVLTGIIILMYNTDHQASAYLKNSLILRTLAGLIVFYAAVSVSAIAFKWYYSRRFNIPRGKKNNVHYGIDNIANLLKSFGVIFAILKTFGIAPLELITSLTIVAAAIAIVTKEYIADFLSGLHLSFSNAFDIGDYIKLDTQKGKVIGIKMLKTILLNDDDDIVIIPNTKVHYGEIINYTKRDARFMSVDFQVALKFINSIEELEDELIESLKIFEEYIEPKSYNLKVVEVKMDHLDLKFQYTLKTIDMELQRKIRKKTMRQIFNFISSRGVGSQLSNHKN